MGGVFDLGTRPVTCYHVPMDTKTNPFLPIVYVMPSPSARDLGRKGHYAFLIGAAYRKDGSPMKHLQHRGYFGYYTVRSLATGEVRSVRGDRIKVC